MVREIASVAIMFMIIGGGFTVNPVPVIAQSLQQTEDILQWKTYVDNDGEFTIQYPGGYNVTEVHKTESDGTTKNEVIFQRDTTSVYIVSISKYNYETPGLNNEQDYIYHLEKWWNDTTRSTLSNKDTDLVKPPEFKAYTLAGKQAGSIILKITANIGKIHNVLQVGRILNNGDVILALGTLEPRFKQELPQMEHIIESLRLASDRYNFKHFSYGNLSKP